MRNRTLNLLAAALLLFGATSASAYSLSISARGEGQTVSSLTSTAVVTVDVFFDNVGGNQVGLLSVGVLFDAPGVTYDSVASEALPIIYPAPNYPGTTGSGPSYILYGLTPNGMGSTPTGLYRQQTPWQTFPPPPGKGQVNINFATPKMLESNR